MSRKEELEKLIAEQKKDKYCYKVEPIQITPAKRKSFHLISLPKKHGGHGHPERYRKAFILHLSGDNYSEIAKIFDVSGNTVKRWIIYCYEIYPKNTVL